MKTFSFLVSVKSPVDVSSDFIMNAISFYADDDYPEMFVKVETLGVNFDNMREV